MIPLRRYVVSGHSMEPTFYDGDKLIASSFLFNLQKEDVVVFTDGGRDYVKRVKAVNGDKLVVAGDNSNHSKSWSIMRKQIKGKYLIKY